VVGWLSSLFTKYELMLFFQLLFGCEDTCCPISAECYEPISQFSSLIKLFMHSGPRLGSFKLVFWANCTGSASLRCLTRVESYVNDRFWLCSRSLNSSPSCYSRAIFLSISCCMVRFFSSCSAKLVWNLRQRSYLGKVCGAFKNFWIV